MVLLLGTTGTLAAAQTPSSASSGAAGAASTAPASPSDFQPYCDLLARQTNQPEALAAACRFALSLEQTLPNVICDQRTARYADNMGGSAQRLDVVMAQVTSGAGRSSTRFSRSTERRQTMPA